MDISIDIQSVSEDDDQPPPEQIKHWATAVISPRKTSAELSIRIVDEAEILALNSQYRNKHSSTNVLSFPADLPEAIELPLLGDIVICAPIVAKEAIEQGKDHEAHWAHMIIHGTLHLLGYDHIEDDQAEVMEQLEIDILNTFNFPNPYQTSSEESTQSYDRRTI